LQTRELIFPRILRSLC